jgi:hypothetical protein
LNNDSNLFSPDCDSCLGYGAVIKPVGREIFQDSKFQPIKEKKGKGGGDGDGEEVGASPAAIGDEFNPDGNVVVGTGGITR